MNSDMVFAKNSLAKFLDGERKEYFPFESFADVIPVLSKFLSKKT